MALAPGTPPRMTASSPPATTLSLADILRRRDMYSPLLLRPRLRWSPLRWRWAGVRARVQVWARQGLRRPQATQAPPPATARDRLPAEGPLDNRKGRPRPAFPFQQRIQYTGGKSGG